MAVSPQTFRKFGTAITGFAELDAGLSLFKPSLQRKGIRKATRASAKIVADQMKKIAPVDQGELLRTIKVKAIKRNRRGDIGHGVDSGHESRDMPYYAQFLEFGTKERFHKSGKSVGELPEDGFAREALYISEFKVKATFMSVLRDWINVYARQDVRARRAKVAARKRAAVSEALGL